MVLSHQLSDLCEGEVRFVQSPQSIGIHPAGGGEFGGRRGGHAARRAEHRGEHAGDHEHSQHGASAPHQGIVFGTVARSCIHDAHNAIPMR